MYRKVVCYRWKRSTCPDRLRGCTVGGTSAWRSLKCGCKRRVVIARAWMGSSIAILMLCAVNDPSRLSLTQTVKFTEDGQRLNLGDGLWNTATGRGTYKFYMDDVQAGQVGFFGTMREAGEPIIISLRLKIENHKIAEIETIVVRNKGEAENLEKRGHPDPLFTETIPAADRVSRAELVKTANMYFSGMQLNDGKGDYPFTDDCDRVENGMEATNNRAANTADAVACAGELRRQRTAQG